MKQKTKAEISRLITNMAIYKTDDSRIEEIADRFPEEYSTEQEYVEFQLKIAKMIEEKAALEL